MGRDDGVSRRTLLKSVAVGSAGLGLAGAAVVSSDRYIVGARSEAAVAAASHVADSGPRRIDLGPYGSLLVGEYSSGMRASLGARDDVEFVQPDRTLQAPPPGPGERDGAGDDAGFWSGLVDRGQANRGGDTGSRSEAGADDGAAGGTLPWGIDRIDADVAHDDGDVGEGIDVAVIDTGIDDAHSDLEAALADPDGDDNHRAWAECRGDDCTHPWSDDGGHGTHVSGTIAAADDDGGVVGVAPGVTLHALKVCDGGGACRTSAIADAVRYAADQGWDVANLSLGSPRESPALEAAGKYALDRGLVLVAAAGNAGPCDDCVGYPAAHDEYIAVAASSIDDTLARFSSTGDEVAVAAPGDEVCSSVVGGYDALSGTSMASPHVAGAAAQLIADGYAGEEVRDRLRETAEDVGLDDTEQGDGLVDVAAALGLDSSDDGTGDGTDCPS